MPSTDRKLELTAKASMAQPVSQTAVCSNGLNTQGVTVVQLWTLNTQGVTVVQLWTLNTQSVTVVQLSTTASLSVTLPFFASLLTDTPAQYACSQHPQHTSSSPVSSPQLVTSNVTYDHHLFPLAQAPNLAQIPLSLLHHPASLTLDTDAACSLGLTTAAPLP